MSDRYTPSTAEVQGSYDEIAGSDEVRREARAEFQRWLAQVRAEAWDEGARAAHNALGRPFIWFKPVNPYAPDHDLGSHE